MERKSKLNARKEEIEKLLNEGAYIRDIAETFGVSKHSLYKYIRKKISPDGLKNSKIKRNEQINERIIKLLNTEATIKSIAETFDVHVNTLYKYIKEVSPDSLKQREIKRYEQIEERIKELFDTGVSLKSIAKTLEISEPTLYRHIKNLNLDTFENRRIKRHEQLRSRIKELLDAGANKRYVAKMLNMSKSNLNYYIKIMGIEIKRNN